jgi:hypothetical protein
MSYKFSLGERTLDDITAEVDAQANTKIDFEEDYIGLVTSGSSTLVVSGSQVGVGTSRPSQVLDIDGNTIRLRSQRTVPSSNTFGEAGEICYDANYIYICIGIDTWKRVALSSW